MKKIITVMIIFVLVNSTYSAFREIEQAGPRVMGLGYAFTGLADDINAVLINPAGLVNVKSMTFSLSGSALYPELKDENIYKGNILGGMPLFSKFYIGAGYGFLSTEYYRENLVNLAAAYIITEKINVGINTKLFNWSGQVVSLFREVKGDYGSTRIGFDLGMLYLISDFLSFGMSFIDINQPDIASDSSKVKDRISTDYKFGLAYKKYPINADIDFGYCDEIMTQAMGLEYGLFNKFLFLRSGIILYDMSSKGYQFNFGMSVNIPALSGSMRADYSFGLNGIDDSLGIHHMAVIYSF